jgi:hypothetical protein
MESDRAIESLVERFEDDDVAARDPACHEAFSSRSIKRSKPSRMVSGCGGQPGMNKSTGTIALAP